MKRICFLLVWITSTLSAQDLPTDLKRGRLQLTDGKPKVYFSDFYSKQKDSFFIRKNPRTDYQKIALENVLILEQQTGNKALAGALWAGIPGALGGILVGGLFSAIGADKGLATTIAVIGTASWMGIGAAIGSAVKKYKTVYVAPGYDNLKFKTSFHLGLQTGEYAGVGLVIKFE